MKFLSLDRDRLISTLALLAAMVLWGSSFVTMKYAFAFFNPLVVVFARLALASLVFLPFAPSFRRLPLAWRHVPPLLAMALCEPCLYFVFEAAALTRTTASQAAMITTMLPLLVALCAALFLGERLSRRTMAGFLVAASGALWLSLAGQADKQAPNPALGNLLEFLAMVSAAGYVVLAKHLSRSFPALFLTAIQAFIGALFFLPLLLLPSVELPSALPTLPLLSVLYLGIFVSAGAYGLYNFGVGRVPANQAGAFINLIPALALFFGFFLLDERLGAGQYAACLLVFGGVFLSQDNRADPTRGSANQGGMMLAGLKDAPGPSAP